MRKEVHMQTNRQLLPGDIIGSTGVVNYQVRGSEGCPAALLHRCLVPYHRAMLHGLAAYPEDPDHKYSIFYRKLCVDHNQCLKETGFGGSWFVFLSSLGPLRIFVYV